MIEYLFILYSHKNNINHCTNLLNYYKKNNKYIKNNIKFIIITGDPTIANNYNICDDHIVLKCEDSYNCLTFKTIELIKFIKKEYPNIKGCFKCDDDVFISFKRLNIFFDLINEDTDYIGLVSYKNYTDNNYLRNITQTKRYNLEILDKLFDLNISFSETIFSYCGGPIYYLSSKSINYLYNDIINNSFIKIVYEDMSIGYNLYKNNIFPLHYNLYNDCVDLFNSINSICGVHNFSFVKNIIEKNQDINDRSENKNKKIIMMDNIGMNGRLANQLFQLSYLLHLSLEYNYNLVINTNNIKNLTNIFNLKNTYNDLYYEIENNVIIKRPFKKYNEIKLYNDNNNVKKFLDINSNFNININGYYQLFIKEYTIYKNIFLILQFNFDIQQYSYNYINKISENSKYDIICLHIRLGDYITTHNNIYNSVLAWNNINNIYNTIINLIKNNNPKTKIIIFSDDIELCKKILTLNYDVIYYDTFKLSPHEDLCIMSFCKYFVLSNSTYGLWGYYLCKRYDKIAFFPQNTFKNNSNYEIYNNLISEKLYINNHCKNKNKNLYIFTTDTDIPKFIKKL